MKTILLVLILAGSATGRVEGAGTVPTGNVKSPFSIRGTLPWHNFLSGPTAWNETAEALFRTFSQRVRSRGELGEMSSLNQKLGLEYRELDQFLAEAEK